MLQDEARDEGQGGAAGVMIKKSLKKGWKIISKQGKITSNKTMSTQTKPNLFSDDIIVAQATSGRDRKIGSGDKVITPFRYPGGKFYALKHLEPFWLAVDHDEYREPFVGGGSVFFAKPKAKFNWINDIDNDLITTYQVIQDPKLSKEVLGLLTKEEASPERWKEVKNLKPNAKLGVAFKYYYLNRTSFSGKMVSSAWGYRPKRSVPPHRWGEKIASSHGKLSNVKITSIDFEKVITAAPKGKKVLMFLDPPYFNPPKKKHYVNGFGEADHQRLRDTLKSTKHKFFLTYEDCKEIRQSYEWANIYPVKFFYRVDNSNIFKTKRRVGNELIITNYKLDHGFFEGTL